LTRRDYFLACLSAQLTHRKASEALLTREEIQEIQSEAWRLAEEAIPEDPAKAALEFFNYFARSGYVAPEWLATWYAIRKESEDR